MADISNGNKKTDFNNWRPLTKSRFKSAIECPTKLFYYGKDKEYSNLSNEDEFLQALAEGGYQVGELAKLYYPGGHDIKDLGYEEPLKKTNELLKQENVIIYEAAVAFENFFIRVDILKKTGDTIELIEVKAKSFNPEKEKFLTNKGYIYADWKPYLYDIAFQTWITKHAFPDIEIKSFLYLCDKSKVATVNNLNQLFFVKRNEAGRKEVIINKDISQFDLGQEILIKIPVDSHVNMILEGRDTNPRNADNETIKKFGDRAREYAKFYFNDEKYPITLDTKCKKCEYKIGVQNNTDILKSGYEECWKSLINDFDGKKPHIFDIWYYLRGKSCIDKGIYYIEDLYAEPELYNALNERQQIQVQKTGEGDRTEDIKPELFNEINSWKFPFHFIDFETCRVAIPFNKGRRPYEQTAFQFSCHSMDEDRNITHQEWIQVEPGLFPNYNFVLALKEILEKDTGTIFRYTHYENTVLREIQKQMIEDDESKYAELIEWIDTITEWKIPGTKHKECGERCMVDMFVVLKKYYYHPLMGGSNSLKVVLPAIMSTSEKLKEIYSKPVGFGINLSDKILWEIDENKGVPKDPYKLLPDRLLDIDLTKEEMVLEDGKIDDGAAAMIAFAKMQFTVMTELERNTLKQALLQYCELDTLAMVMLYQHWKSLE